MTAIAKVFTTAGTKLFVSTTVPVTINQSGFAAITAANWKEIGEITDLGDGYGRTYNLVTHNAVGTRQTIKLKGTFNDGAFTLQYAEKPGDEGQAMLLNGVDSDANLSFKLVKGNEGTPISVAFLGLVMTTPMSLGSADTVTGYSTQVEINSPIIKL